MQYNSIFAVYSDWEYLNVWKPWSYVALISPATLTVLNNEQIVLKCTCESYDVRDFKWYKDEIKIESGGTFSRVCLQINIKYKSRIYLIVS